MVYKVLAHLLVFVLANIQDRHLTQLQGISQANSRSPMKSFAKHDQRWCRKPWLLQACASPDRHAGNYRQISVVIGTDSTYK